MYRGITSVQSPSVIMATFFPVPTKSTVDSLMVLMTSVKVGAAASVSAVTAA